VAGPTGSVAKQRRLIPKGMVFVKRGQKAPEKIPQVERTSYSPLAQVFLRPVRLCFAEVFSMTVKMTFF